jgi:tetratricopeptide (TPR) repeat protein
MAAKYASAHSDQAALDDAAGLLALALSIPAAALARAREILLSDADELSASYAHQAAGIVLRDRGELPAALRELRAAIRCAQRSGRPEREVDIRATLGAALVMAGRSRQGLEELDAAAASAHGELLAKIRLRRAHVLFLVGRCDEALVDLHRGLTVVRRSGDLLWQARILNNRCLVHLAVGDLRRADADATAAESLFDRLGQGLESVQACHNRAIVASGRGDLPGALRLLDLAESRYRTLDVFEPDLVMDRGQVLLAAGLATDAVEAAVDALAEHCLQPVKRAELLFFAAKAALAAGQPGPAREWAQEATRLLHIQQRAGWEARARLLSYQARYLSGDRTEHLLTSLLDIAPRLADLHVEEASLAYLLAGRLARYRGHDDIAVANFGMAAANRRAGSPLTRATGWLAVAMQASASGNTGRRLLQACARGLDALDEHRLVFGAAELRAIATSHGRDLATLAIDAAAASGSPRSMLQWTERWRATSLAEPSVRTTDDPELQQQIAALRDTTRRLDELNSRGASTSAVRQQRRGYEAAVWRRRLRVSGHFGLPPRLDIDEVCASLGTSRLITLVEAGGALHTLTVADGRVRKHRIGSLDEALRELKFARFALRRAAHARAAPAPDLADRLQRVLLGPAVRLLDGGPVVIVPPAVLHQVPWGLLPALEDAVLSVSPSVTMWLRARAAAARPPRDRRVCLVLGPELGQGRSEISSLATLHEAAAVLGLEQGADPATVERVLSSMSGAWLAHIVAHGCFRADSPLFSSLDVDDGPLFVHDLERLDSPPLRVVLSACDSGVATPVGADELLGLVSGLLGVGTAGVLASVVPVNDEASVPFMVTVHQALIDGKAMPEAALEGRRAARRDPLTAATAASFSVWGA